jgi:hypothetical protein
MKRFRLAISVSIALLFLLVNATGIAAESNKDGSSPVFARDVELAKKIQVERGKGSAKPPKTTTTYASTGNIGAEITGSKYAIVIGISNYPGTNNDLELCDDDANDVLDALVDTYHFDAANIIKLIDSENDSEMVATRDSIFNAIDEIKGQVVAGDEVVFFFSGHGGRGKADDNDKEVIDECIWAHNGSSSLLPIWDGELATAFSGFETDRIIFIFDSCYAGGMTDLAGPGRVVAMASTENSLSYEISGIGNGEFTYYMIDQGILSGLLADKNTDGAVTVEEAWDYAKLNCRYDSVTISDSFPDDLLP